MEKNVECPECESKSTKVRYAELYYDHDIELARECNDCGFEFSILLRTKVINWEYMEEEDYI